MADVTTAVSSTDAEYYLSLVQNPQKVHIFPNVVDVSAYQQVPPPAANLKKPCIYLAGTFGPNSPMEDAARWVIQDVLPHVRQQVPGIHFYIVGIGSDQVLSDVQDPGVTVVGQVLSVLPYLCHADVALVPLRFESGTRFKILEAFACHVPVVSTTLGAEGLNVVDGQHLLLADTPAQFAEAIQRVLSDGGLRERLVSASYTLVDQEYSLPAAERQAKSILRALGF